jgi:pyruvate carboxylase
MATVAKATLQCRLGYDRMSSLAQTIGRYRSYSGGGGTTVKLSRTISLIGQVDGRHYDANGTMLRRSILHASPGLSWSPGERPLAIW